MKITTTKLPRSLIALQIEVDKDRFERGLDQAARRLAQKYPLHGFRPGKAPRFMIERTFGREELIKEASEDLVNKAFRDALKREEIDPVGPANFEGVSSLEPFTFKVTVPVKPTVAIGAYRDIRVPLELPELSEEQFQRTMDRTLDRHVALKELDAPRPAQEGDQLEVRLETLVEGQLLEERPEGEPPPEQVLDLVEGRLVDELYQGLLGVNIGDQVEIKAQMPDDHESGQVRGKEVTFKVEILGIQERVLPPWEELPALESFEGDLAAFQAQTRSELEESIRAHAERQTIDTFIDQLVAQADYDMPDVMVESFANSMLEEQGQQFARYGVTLEQMLQYRGQTREQAIKTLLPDAEKQVKVTLALQTLVQQEQIMLSEDEIEAEEQRMLSEYEDDQRVHVAKILKEQLRDTVARAALDRKLRTHILALATAEAVDTSAPTVTE
ncbi:MAG: trigger factor [Candidatus Viridilinea halotolerans]|uniref:Trigger factor n=1 Tax=Candidatus Viridilinea halotolerans TaxID=2491704 RepID=A0A426TUS0_9CHLR|nr:MAG: trigger factor [Candidatus Viridilinea halotolerans]